MRENMYIFLAIFFFANICHGQNEVRTFVFGHSLINHEFQVNPTPSQETSVPHWFQDLSDASGYAYAVDGQYGFLPQHANLPPIAQWGFDNASGAWDSDNEPFSTADFTNILITPGNFIQWQSPSENYPSEDLSPLSATVDVFEWCDAQEPDMDYYIYENWPDMGGFLGSGFPPSSSELEDYHAYLNGDFHEWFLEYYDLVSSQFPDRCVRMIPVGPIISKIITMSPLDQIAITEWYEDDAPHGRANVYFLASMITYMAMHEEKTAPDYQVKEIIDPLIASLYPELVDFIWAELNAFVDDEGNSIAFCNTPVVNSSSDVDDAVRVSFSPNPVQDVLIIDNSEKFTAYTIYNSIGIQIRTNEIANLSDASIDVSLLEGGVYYLKLENAKGDSFASKFVKLGF